MPANGTPGPWLTVNEAARYLNMHPGSVRRLIRQGDLAASRVGERGRLRLRRVDVEALLRANGGQEGIGP